MAAVYDLIARALPTEGRDYAVDFTFEDGKVVSVGMRSYTAVGKAWCAYCTELLKAQGNRRSS